MTACTGSGGSRAGAARRRVGGRPRSVATLVIGAALAASGAAWAPALAATVSAPSPQSLHAASGAAVPADRKYPVLVDSAPGTGTGTLTEIGPTRTVSLALTDPGPIAITPDGRYAYVATTGGLAVISGVKTGNPQIAAMVKTGGTPGGIAITPDGAEVYVTVSTAKRSLVRAYTGASTGKLRFRTSVTTKPGANAIAITPDGRYAYVAVNDVPYLYTLTEIGGVGTSRLKVLSNSGVGGYPEAVTVTPNGRYLYLVTNMGIYGAAYVFRNVQSAHPVAVRQFAPQGDVGRVAVTPNGRWAYAPYGPGRLVVIRNAESSPNRAGTIRLGQGLGQMVIQPDGRYAMEARGTSADSLIVLTGTASGRPRVATTWKLAYYPYNVAISPVP